MKTIYGGAVNFFKQRIKALDDSLKDEILRSVALTGSVDNPSFQPIIASNSNQVLDLGKGLPKVKRVLIPKFKLILTQPLIISALPALSIRCVLCGSVIRYPAWYMSIRYNTNWFHYFVCFDSNSTDKVSAKCYRR